MTHELVLHAEEIADRPEELIEVRRKLAALTPHIYDAAMRLSHKSSGQSANETAFELVRILEGWRAENDD